MQNRTSHGCQPHNSFSTSLQTHGNDAVTSHQTYVAMLYFLAILFSLVASVQSFASEITAGNITHLKNGRLPNAGAAIFPTIPIFQLLSIAAAWLLRRFTSQYAIWILIGSFLIFSLVWTLSFWKLSAEFNRIKNHDR